MLTSNLSLFLDAEHRILSSALLVVYNPFTSFSNTISKSISLRFETLSTVLDLQLSII